MFSWKPSAQLGPLNAPSTLPFQLRGSIPRLARLYTRWTQVTWRRGGWIKAGKWCGEDVTLAYKINLKKKQKKNTLSLAVLAAVLTVGQWKGAPWPCNSYPVFHISDIHDMSSESLCVSVCVRVRGRTWWGGESEPVAKGLTWHRK